MDELIIAQIQFDEGELILGVADTYIQALRIAAAFREGCRKDGTRYEKVANHPMTYLEQQPSALLAEPEMVVFRFDLYTLNELTV